MIYTSHEAAQRAGITYRQLDYWQRTHLVTAKWCRNQRAYPHSEVVRMRIIKAMLDSGLELTVIRELRIPEFREAGDPREWALGFLPQHGYCEYLRIDDVPGVMSTARQMVSVLPLSSVV